MPEIEFTIDTETGNWFWFTISAKKIVFIICKKRPGKH